MKRLILSTAIAAVCAVATVTPAQAGIVSSGSGINVIATPTPGDGVVNDGDITSTTQLYLWYEGQVALSGTQTLQHSGAGTVNVNFFNSYTPAAQQVQTYYLHFDPASNPADTSLADTAGSLSITFDQEIIGLDVSTTYLNGTSDTAFAPTGLAYTLTNRGMNMGTGTGVFTISADLRTLTINNIRAGSTGDIIDGLRIIINPEPSSFALFGLGLLGAVGLVRRRRRRKTACV